VKDYTVSDKVVKLMSILCAFVPWWLPEQLKKLSFTLTLALPS